MELPELEPDPFAEIARSLEQAAQMEAALAECMTPGSPPDVLLELADTIAILMRRRAILLSDWNGQLDQTYPATN
jgi:hypothetical protein